MTYNLLGLNVMNCHLLRQTIHLLTPPSGRAFHDGACIVVILLLAVPHALKLSVIDFHSFLTIWQMLLNTRARKLSMRLVEIGDLLANRPSCVNRWCVLLSTEHGVASKARYKNRRERIVMQMLLIVVIWATANACAPITVTRAAQ